MGFQLSENSLKLRSRAYDLLGVTHDAVALAPQITPSLAMIEKTAKGHGQRRPRGDHDNVLLPYGPGSDIKSAWPYYLSTCDHPDARKVIYTFNTLPRNLQRVCPIEAFCVAASVPPPAVLDLLVKAVTRAAAQASSILAAANQPRIVQKNVEMALTDEGLGDRTLFSKITGLLPTPRGAQTIVSVQTNASANAAAPTLIAPSPEQTTRRLATKLNEMRGLPAAPTEPQTIDMQMPAREAVTVDAEYESDEDDD